MSATIDLWNWVNIPPQDLDIEILLGLRTTVLCDRERRKEVDDYFAALPPQPSGDHARIAGVCQWLRGMYSQAYPLLKQVPTTPATAFLIAECCLFGGYASYDGVVARPEEAADILLAQKQRSAQHTTLLLRALWVSNRHDELRKVHGETSSDYQRTADGQFFTGLVREFDGEHDAAEHAYDQALQIAPDHTLTLFRRAYRYDLSCDDNEAIALYERLANQRPPDVNSLINLGVLYEDQGRFKDATDCYSRILAAYPNHPRALRYMRDANASMSMYFDEDLEVRNDKKNQILKIPVTDFELSVRSRNCLTKMNIVTLGDLVRHTEAELLSYKNFGETSLSEIKQILEAKGLRLGMKPGDDLSPAKKNAPMRAPVAVVTQNFSVDPNDDRLKKPCTDMNLSVRSRKCLATLNIKSIGDLVQYTAEDLLAQRNFGVTSLKEIQEQLELMSLSLRTVDK